MRGLVACACGCGQQREAADKRGHPRSYVIGHSTRKWVGAVRFSGEFALTNLERV